MKTFNYNVFIGIPRSVINKVCDELNKDFNGYEIQFMVKGSDFKLEVEVTVKAEKFDENEIFQLGTLVGSKMSTAFNIHLNG